MTPSLIRSPKLDIGREIGGDPARNVFHQVEILVDQLLACVLRTADRVAGFWLRARHQLYRIRGLTSA